MRAVLSPLLFVKIPELPMSTAAILRTRIVTPPSPRKSHREAGHQVHILSASCFSSGPVASA
jgi:hypothetical protein